jgi:hypothetical protein
MQAVSSLSFRKVEGFKSMSPGKGGQVARKKTKDVLCGGRPAVARVW